MSRIYISGPISLGGGATKEAIEANLLRFSAHAEALRADGHHVENPADNKAPDDPTWENWMRLAITQLVTCDTILMLNGWAKSSGAVSELMVARMLGMAVKFEEPPTTCKGCGFRVVDK